MRQTKELPFQVYSTGDTKASGCLYYRVQAPIRGLYELGLANGYIDNGVHPRQDRIAVMLTSDIVHMFASGGRLFQATMERARKMKPGPNDKGEMVYPPSFIFDCDDNLDWVHPMNGAFVDLGTRAYDGTLLKPGDQLETIFPDGTRVPLWVDGATKSEGKIFDIVGNHKRIKSIHDTARMADGVIVPAPALAKYYKEVHKCKDVYVFPNSVIPEDYPKAELVPHERVRILWQGGSSHMVDWFPLRDAVREVALKYPQVTFVMWGTAYGWIHDNIPPNQLELWDWKPYEAYKALRVLVDADINLCPLAKNEFNQCKSAIKWYESTMPFRPEATLAANAAPYSEEIVDGTSGLLYDTPEEFVQKLGILIENKPLRLRLGEQARQWVWKERHIHTTVPKLFEFYNEIRAKSRQEHLALV